MAHRVRQLALVEPPAKTINLVTNPSAEQAAAAVVTRTNLVLNPASGTASTGWQSQAGTGGAQSAARQTGQTGWALGITTSVRATWSAPTTAVGGGVTYVGANGPGWLQGFIAGRIYGFAMQARASKVQRLWLQVNWYRSDGTYISSVGSGAEQVVAANTVVTFVLSGVVAPGGADRCSVAVVARAGASATNWLAGDWVEATLAHAEETDVVLVAPGGSALTGPIVGSIAAGIYGPDYTYGWAGAADASVSQQKAPGVASVSATAPTVAVSRSTDRALFGTYSERVVFGTGGAATAGDGQAMTGLTVGQTYTWSRYVYVPAGAPHVRLSVDGIGGSAPSAVRDQWVRLTQTFTATAANHTVRVLNQTATVRGDDVVYVDGSQLEEGSAATDYFSGSTPDVEGTDYSWTGAADASTSQRVVSATWVDLSCEAYEVTIRRGRGDPDEQPEAGTATLDLYSAVPAALDVTSKLQVQTQANSGAWLTRFTGYVTDVGLEYAMAVDPDGMQVVVQPFTRVQCADLLATLGRRYVGDTPWSQELDGPRIRSILTLAGVTGGVVDPGTVALLPRDVDRQPAAELAREVAAQAGGILFITMADAPAYHDAEHRRANQASLTLDACQLAMSPTWTRDAQGLVNEVAVTYGVAPEGSEQPVYTASNPDSQSRYGRLAYSTSSQLATLDDATTRGQALISRNAYPVWDLGQLEVVLATLSAAAFDTLMQLELGALLGLTGLPLGTPETSTAAWVEGWEEHLTADEHQLVLMVSGYCRTAPFVRWDDVAPASTWDSMRSSLRWDQAYCLGPSVSFGRWNDVPGNLFWDDLAATVTWDTWAY
jgi:hypothetical protein